MPCAECGELNTHAFRTVDDLVHAARVAAEETDRGVLSRIDTQSLSQSAQEALDSSLASGALPNVIRYRFRCNVCGDTFALSADTRSAEGEWRREGDESSDS